MINNVVLVSGGQQSDSVIYIHVSILCQILFPFKLLQNIERSSLCYAVGPCLVSRFKYSCVDMSIPTSLTIPSRNPSPVSKSSFSKSVSQTLLLAPSDDIKLSRGGKCPGERSPPGPLGTCLTWSLCRPTSSAAGNTAASGLHFLFKGCRALEDPSSAHRAFPSLWRDHREGYHLLQPASQRGRGPSPPKR